MAISNYFQIKKLLYHLTFVLKSIPYSDLGPFLNPNGPDINSVKGFVPGLRSTLCKLFADLKPGTKPVTIFISGPFGLRKGPRSEYGIDFKSKK